MAWITQPDGKSLKSDIIHYTVEWAPLYRAGWYRRNEDIFGKAGRGQPKKWVVKGQDRLPLRDYVGNLRRFTSSETATQAVIDHHRSGGKITIDCWAMGGRPVAFLSGMPYCLNQP